MWRVAGAALLAAAIAATARAGQAPRVLALELWVNGMCTHRIVRAEESAAGLAVARADLAAEGIAFAGDGPLVSLGASATVDAANQRLMLTVPGKDLPRQVFDLRPSDILRPDPVKPGLMLDYDIAGEMGDVSDIGGTGSLGASAAASLFTPHGVLRGSGIASVNPARGRAVRLDTAFLVDDSDRLLRWTVGDAITGGLSWSRPVRFAGIQLATDYSLRPDLVTIPLPAYLGDASVPSSVDVFVGAAKVFETEVDPGPFEITGLPIVTGGSSATVVVRDALGRETTQTLSLFTTADMLAPGLDEFSLEAGFLRHRYGTRSYDYGAPLAALTWRRGLSDIVTAEAHGEFTGAAQTLGGGIAVGLEPIAVLSVDLAASTRDGHQAGLVDAALTGRWRAFSFFGEYRAATRGYADLQRGPAERRRLEFGAAASLGEYGSLSLSSIESDLDGEDGARLIAASYSLDFEGRFLTATGFTDRASGAWYAGFTFSVLLGERQITSASGQLSPGASTLTASYAHDADPDGGFGYRAAASAGAGAGLDLQGAWYGTKASADAELSERGSAVGLRADLSGSLVAMAGEVFATRRSDGAVALVETGVPGVRIYKENREVAVSDDEGKALVPGLVPFAANRIAIDPDDYPIATVVETSERTVVPGRYAGVTVELAPRIQAPVLMSVSLPDGTLVPAGTAAHLDGRADPLVVGQNGKLFVDDLRSVSEITVDLPGGTCHFSLAPPPRTPERIPDAGRMVCHGA
jgi:outer membrane usher protein